MTAPTTRRRAKISVTVRSGLLRAVDEYVEAHEGLDRSKVVDQALLDWYRKRQDEAMIEQYSRPTTAAFEAEYTDWRHIRRAAAERMLSRQHDED